MLCTSCRQTNNIQISFNEINLTEIFFAGEQLKVQLISQYYTPPDLDSIFGVVEMPNLCEMFSKKKPKFYKRTSSAVWNSPLYLPSGKPYYE